MSLKRSRPRSLPEIKDKNSLTPNELQMVAESSKPFIQMQTYPHGTSEPQQVFLDTSQQQVLYGSPIEDGSPTSNLSTVWILSEQPASGGIGISEGPYIISNVTAPIGQVQPSPCETGEDTYDINVLPVSTRQNFFWKLKFRDDKWAVYYEKPEAGILYALPVKSDDPNQSPPHGNLIKAVRTDQRQQDVFVFNFSWVDSIKYSDALPPGVDILIRPRAHS